MTLYKFLTLINLFGCTADVLIMMVLIVRWEVPRVFQPFYFYMMVCTLLLIVGQAYTLISPLQGQSKWLLKFSTTIFWIMVLLFCRAIKTISVKKIH